MKISPAKVFKCLRAFEVREGRREEREREREGGKKRRERGGGREEDASWRFEAIMPVGLSIVDAGERERHV